MQSFTITVRGRFKVEDSDGQDVTPPFRKERAILALLAFASDHRATRVWLQAMLWSDKPGDKASANLRRSIANLKAFYGAAQTPFDSDRFDLWLVPGVTIDDRPDRAGQQELLDMMDVPDEAFAEWLRDLRSRDHAEVMGQPGALAFEDATHLPALDGTAPAWSSEGGAASRSAAMSGRTPHGTVIVISVNERASSDHALFLDRLLVDTLAARFESEGAHEIYAMHKPPDERLKHAATVIHIELVTMLDSAGWHVHLRALADQERRFLWSGRLNLATDEAIDMLGLRVQAFVSQALSQIVQRFRAFRRADLAPMMLIQRAAGRLYFHDPGGFDRSMAELKDLATGDHKPLATAWHAFGDLVRVLEHGGAAAVEIPKAKARISEAVFGHGHNPLIAALAARVALDGENDLDKAQYYADRAVLNDDTNPYALLAASRVAMIKGAYDEAYALSRDARLAATGLPQVFAWEMELCLTALSVGQYDEAYRAARSALGNNPTHRAALRYMVALGDLRQDAGGVRQAVKELRRLEPGFEPAQLRMANYPMLTLQRLGLADELSF